MLSNDDKHRTDVYNVIMLLALMQVQCAITTFLIVMTTMLFPDFVFIQLQIYETVMMNCNDETVMMKLVCTLTLNHSYYYCSYSTLTIIIIIIIIHIIIYFK